MTQDRNFKMANLVYVCILSFLYAMTVTMTGTVLYMILEEFAVSYSTGSLIVVFQSLGGFITILLSRVIIDRHDKMSMINIVFCVLGISLVMFSLSKSFVMVTVCFLLLGSGVRMGDTLLNAFLSESYKDSEKNAYLNLAHAIFGIGALIGPIYVLSITVKYDSWRLAFIILGILLFVTVIISMWCKYHVLNMTSKIKSHNKEMIISENSIEICVTSNYETNKFSSYYLYLCMFLYCGHQSLVITWFPTYTNQYLIRSENYSNLIISFLWIGIILGRLLCTILVRRFVIRHLIMFGSATGSFCIFFSILLSNNRSMFLMLTLLAGFFTGAMIPLIILEACSEYKQNIGKTTTTIFLFGVAGNLVFPWLTGFLADKIDLKTSINFAWILLVMVFVLSFAAGRCRSEENDHTKKLPTNK